MTPFNFSVSVYIYIYITHKKIIKKEKKKKKVSIVGRYLQIFYLPGRENLIIIYFVKETYLYMLLMKSQRRGFAKNASKSKASASR
jgi:hypothetical protein